MDFSSLMTSLGPIFNGLIDQVKAAMQSGLAQVQTALGSYGWIVGIAVGFVMAKMLSGVLRVILIVAVALFVLSKLNISLPSLPSLP